MTKAHLLDSVACVQNLSQGLWRVAPQRARFTSAQQHRPSRLQSTQGSRSDVPTPPAKAEGTWSAEAGPVGGSGQWTPKTVTLFTA